MVVDRHMRHDAGLLVLLWLAGVYMRLPILAAPPLAPSIADELALSQTHIGALTTLPVLMLSLGALIGSLLIMRLGPRPALVLALLVVGAASAARGLAFDAWSLLAISALMGIGIAIMQPALPALLPRWLAPSRIALGTACYMNGSLIGEFTGAGLTLPLIMPLTGDSWRLSLLVWSIPAIVIALMVLIPGVNRDNGEKASQWLPRLNDPLMWKLGLLLGGTASMFFGTNAYMASVLEERGALDQLDATLAFFNFAQVLASLAMIVMASRWVGRRGPILLNAGLGVLCMLGFLGMEGWAALASAVLMSYFAGVLLILIVALPPQLVSSNEAGRLSAGNFMIGYAMAFVIPLIGGALADTTGTSLAAIGFIVAAAALTVPLAARLRLPW